MSIHDDPTQTSPAQPQRKRRPWYRRWYVISPAALAVGIITISAMRHRRQVDPRRPPVVSGRQRPRQPGDPAARPRRRRLAPTSSRPGRPRR